MKPMFLGMMVLFALIMMVPMSGSSFAETVQPMSEEEGEEGQHEGKSCPFKEKKGFSVIGLNL